MIGGLAMNAYKLISDYKDDATLRGSFNRLAKETFNIDFEKWYELGFWGDQYICYSLMDRNEIISNVSVSTMDLIISGKRVPALQIGTVMTRPEYRGKGLAKRLMEIVLDKYEPEYDLIYLFANPSVLDFYPKFGFTRVMESKFTTHLKFPSGVGSFRKLDVSSENDWQLFLQFVAARKPVSDTLGVENMGNLLCWYALNVFGDHIYYSEKLAAIVIYELDGNRMVLYDVISRDRIHLNNLAVHLGGDGKDDMEVLFQFTPEYDGVSFKTGPNDSHDTLFVKARDLALPDQFLYPLIAHT